MASPIAHPQRRWPAVLLACALAGPAGAAPAATVRVWVELDEPALAASAPADTRQRAQAIERQQIDTARALQDLGGTDIARTRHLGSAIAVRIAPDKLDAVRALPGVRRVRPADTLHPPGLNEGSGGPGAKTR